MERKLLKLTSLDKKILYELDLNSRKTLTKLAKTVRSSPPVVDYRLKRMEKAGLIKKYLTLLDPGKLGLMIWNVYIAVEGATKKEEDEILGYLCGMEKTWWVAKCSGSWDVVYSICVKDVKEFYNTVNDVNSRFGRFINRQTVAAHAEVEIISRGYLTGKPGIGVTWYKKIENVPIDDKDVRILAAIAENARLPSSEIARKTGLTTRTVAYRLKHLSGSGVISRFRMQLDTSKMGKSFYKATISVKGFTEENNTRLKEYCIRQGNIVHYEQKVGPWMLELELDAENYEEADSQMEVMKEMFPDFIRSYDLLLIKEEVKGELNLARYAVELHA